MPAIKLTVNHPAGLHARPAAVFVNTAKKFACNITVCNLTAGKPAANAKSILSVLTQGINQGFEIELCAEGEGSEEALETLKSLIDGNFGE